MKKKVMLILVLSLLISSGCTNKKEDNNKTSDVSDDVVYNQHLESSDVNNDENYDNTSDTFSNNEDERNFENLSIIEARPFFNGVSWVKTIDNWCIIDVLGKIVKKFDTEYDIITDFESGFSYIKNSTDSMIVNRNGDVLIDIAKDGYTKIWSYDYLNDGIIILEKNIDTFEKSGNYYYFYDLNSMIEFEICGRDEINNLQYLGNGYYTIDNNKIENYLQDISFSILEDENVLRSFSEGYSILGASFYKLENNYLIEVSAENFGEPDQVRCFKLNLNEQKLSPASINETSQDYVMVNGIGDNIKKYGTGVFIVSEAIGRNSRERDSWNEYFYDISTDKYTVFSPNCDYNCNLIDYENDLFFCTTENNNGTLFFTLIDWNMEPLFTPMHYSNSTALFEDFLVYNDNESIVFYSIKDAEIMKSIDKGTIIYNDYSNDYTWIKDEYNTTCYDVRTGDIIISISNEVNILSDFSNDYVLIQYEGTNQIHYINSQGKILNILDE